MKKAYAIVHNHLIVTDIKHWGFEMDITDYYCPAQVIGFKRVMELKDDIEHHGRIISWPYLLESEEDAKACVAKLHNPRVYATAIAEDVEGYDWLDAGEELELMCGDYTYRLVDVDDNRVITSHKDFDIAEIEEDNGYIEEDMLPYLKEFEACGLHITLIEEQFKQMVAHLD